jgi:hypothetical protein
MQWDDAILILVGCTLPYKGERNLNNYENVESEEVYEHPWKQANL